LERSILRGHRRDPAAEAPVGAGSHAILADIRSIVEIESPSRNAAGVNRVLEAIASLFEGIGAARERQPTTPLLGDILRVRCDPTRNEPGILVAGLPALERIPIKLNRDAL
jgi:hypothetical protein